MYASYRDCLCAGNVLNITVKSWHECRLLYDYALTRMISYSISLLSRSWLSVVPQWLWVIALIDYKSVVVTAWVVAAPWQGHSASRGADQTQSYIRQHPGALWNMLPCFSISLERQEAGAFCHCVVVHRNNQFISCDFFSRSPQMFSVCCCVWSNNKVDLVL